jgi:hypothetical protein
MGIRLAIAVALSSVLVTGCGGDSSGSSPGDSGSTADSTAHDGGVDAPAGDDTGSGDAPSGDDAGDASSCGAGDAGTTGPIPRAAFAATFADGLCSAWQGCCGQAGLPYDPVNCRAYQTQNWNVHAQQYELGGLTYDPQAARDCLNGFVSEACTCDATKITEGPDDAFNAACGAMFVGNTPTGGMCVGDTDCATKAGTVTVCAGTSTTVEIDAGGMGVPIQMCTGGTCENLQPGDPAEEATKHGAAGDTCGGTCAWDQAGVFCSLVLGLGVQPGCHGSPVGCFPDDGVYCDPASAKCKPLPSTAGADCEFLGPDGGTIGSGEVNCHGDGLSCQKTASPDGGSRWACAANDPSAPCDPSGFNSCGDTYYCSETPLDGGTLLDGGGACAPLKPNGQPCDYFYQCQAGACDPPFGSDGGASVCHIRQVSTVNALTCSGNAGMIVPQVRGAKPSFARFPILGLGAPIVHTTNRGATWISDKR